jgi:hypothetical protein
MKFQPLHDRVGFAGDARDCLLRGVTRAQSRRF